MFYLQSLVKCDDNGKQERLAYLRGTYWIDDQRLNIEQGDEVTFDSFYNIFSLPVWKKKCGVNFVTIVFVGIGRVKIELACRGLDNKDKAVVTKEMELEQEHTISFSLEELPDTDILFLKISALSAVSISEINYCTNDKPKREVKLGIGITHYNRVQEVTENVNKLYLKLSKDPSLEGKYEICVVDNSNNLDKNSLPPVTVIPSKNFGGSGGFMRALMHFQEDPSFTHVLFMDDDAKCEVESIRRTIAIMQYVNDDSTAVSGTTLSKENPLSIIDKGAYFNFHCQPRFWGFDISQSNLLVQFENPKEECNYGAWCFFCFPTKALKNYCFPFFVRGDDVNFSLTNGFPIIAPAGIVCYIDPYNNKWSPRYAYLDIRAHLVNCLFQSRYFLSVIFFSVKSLEWIFTRQIAHFHAAQLALRHVLEGKSFWEKHIDGDILNDELGRRLLSSYKLLNLQDLGERFQLDYLVHECTKPKLSEKILRLICLNGIFLPLKNRCIVVPMYQTVSLKAICHYRYAFYVVQADKGFFVEVNRFQVLLDICRFSKDFVLLAINLRKLHKCYKKVVPELGQKQFWEKVFCQSANVVDVKPCIRH